MKYMMMICREESVAVSPEERHGIISSTQSWVEEMDGRGVRVLGHALQPVSDATTVRVRGGDVLVADGPFAETKEQIGGYSVLDCADLDTATAIAAAHPLARTATVELRPYWDAPWDH